MRRWTALAFLALLAGCVSLEEQRAMDQQQCAGFGFAPGTDGFANCMMRTAQQRQAQQDAANKAANEKSYQDWLTLSGHGQQDLPSMTPGAEPDPG